MEMIYELKANGFAKKRGFFEQDAKFKGEMAKVLLDAYEKASSEAARSARHAVSQGDIVEMRRAQWDESVAETLERTLCCVLHTMDSDEFEKSEEIELPDSPSFN